MKINNSDIEAVAVKPAQYPPENLKEIAFAGRSNVGKSSLLNLLTGRKKLAKVSGNPGKTRTINFYLINDEFRIVDLPGYGYAKVSKSVSEGWGGMIEKYLETRSNLLKVVQLVDIGLRLRERLALVSVRRADGLDLVGNLVERIVHRATF